MFTPVQTKHKFNKLCRRKGFYSQTFSFSILNVLPDFVAVGVGVDVAVGVVVVTANKNRINL